jgi:glyoxylate reductase
MPRIFVTRNLPEKGLVMLREAFGEDQVDVFQGEDAMTHEQLLSAVKGADALHCTGVDQVGADVMDAAGPQLKVIATYSVGFNHIDIAAATARGIAVSNTPGVLTETTADLAWALLMAAARRVAEADRLIRAGGWHGWGPGLLLGCDVHGKTLGIFGMGGIGQCVARRAQGFNMRVLYTKRTPLDTAALERELGAGAVDKATLLAESDFLSINCALTPETQGAFGPAEFKAMKRTAILVNTSRGPVVDEAAIVEALKAGDIAAAGLDVFHHAPTLHPGLLELDNVVLTAHIGSASRETRSRMCEMNAESIIARLRGGEPPNCLNPEAL